MAIQIVAKCNNGLCKIYSGINGRDWDMFKDMMIRMKHLVKLLLVSVMVFEIQLFFLLLWGPSSRKHGATTF